MVLQGAQHANGTVCPVRSALWDLPRVPCYSSPLNDTGSGGGTVHLEPQVILWVFLALGKPALLTDVPSVGGSQRNTFLCSRPVRISQVLHGGRRATFCFCVLELQGTRGRVRRGQVGGGRPRHPSRGPSQPILDCSIGEQLAWVLALATKFGGGLLHSSG